MKKIAFLSLMGILMTHQMNAQESDEAVLTVTEETEAVDVISREKALKRESKEAKKAAKAIKRQNKLENTVVNLEKKIILDKGRLEKWNTRLNAHGNLDEVKKKKIELKIAKTERRLANNKDKLKRVRSKLY